MMLRIVIAVALVVSGVDAMTAEVDGYMSLDEVREHMADIKEISPREVSLDTVSRTIPMMFLSRKDGSAGKAKVWIQGALHGNEPAGTAVAFIMARRILEGNLLDYMDVVIVPVANPDGYSERKRRASGGIDLNRDFTKLSHKHTRALSRTYSRFSPDVAIDLHEYNPRRKEFADYFGRDMETGYDVLFLPSGHPNIDQELRSLVSELYIPEARKALAHRLYTSDIYFTPSIASSGHIILNRAGYSPRSTSTRWALGNAVSVFVEIKGLGMSPATFPRRVDCGVTVVENVLNTLVSNIDRTLTAVADARGRAVSGAGDVVVEWERGKSDAGILLRDEAAGVDTVALFPARDAMLNIPQVSRKRPKAYVVRDVDGEVRSRLSAMGIGWMPVNPKDEMIVETYHIVDLVRDSVRWEGIYPVTVRTNHTESKRKFGEEYISVSVKQPAGNLAVTLLEPESSQGFVNFGVIPVDCGEELPIYRRVD